MNPILGIFFHAVGGFAAGSFYIPYSKVKNWSWEVYWLVGGFFAWILAPWIVSLIAVPDLFALLRSLSLDNLVWPYIFGVLWGIGGLTFGLTMRYLGISLGMAMALGLTATFGTLVPPVYFGQFGTLISHLSGLVTLGGVLIALIGIALTGKAGIEKDKEMTSEQKKKHIKEFDLKKGIWVALFAGVMSACFAFGIAAGKPIAALAIEMGTSKLFSNSPVFIVILAGGFTTNFLWCISLTLKNGSIKDYIKTADTPRLANYFFSALAGTTWYFQFMFYGMGTTKMGKYDFASWSIHMSFIIVFSTMWGLILKEWKGSSSRTIRIVLIGLTILILSTFVIGAGNYIQIFE
ncbi:MAG: L-rhamnose/proton symporter RhaT [Actinobacteria bacterium]|nr:L-rhamnose/proton symporter RhaT [Actinomycetota bacterium]